MAGHIRLSMKLMRQLEANDIIGAQVCKYIKLIEVQSGGSDSVGATARDSRSFINEGRRLRLVKKIQA